MMKSSGSFLFLAASVAASIAHAAPAEAVSAAAEVGHELRPAAILDLQSTGMDEAVTRNLADLFVAEAGKVPGYKIISQAEIKDMLGFEVQKQALGCEDASCFAQIGGALGVDLIVTGTIGKVGESYLVNVRLINIAKGETENRVGESLAGRLELLPPFMRVAAWRLFAKQVPAEVLAAYDAVATQMATPPPTAPTLTATASTAPTTRTEVSATAAPSSWQRTAKRAATGVAFASLFVGGVAHGYSFMKAGDLGDSENTAYGKVWEGSQTDAQKAWDYRTYALAGYGIAGAAAVAAVVFAFLEPVSPTPVAGQWLPTGNGFVVVF